jgi:protein TonB
MNQPYSSRKNQPSDRSRILLYSLLLSFLLHVIVVIVLPLIPQDTKVQPRQKPTIVNLVDLPTKKKQPQEKKPAEYEIDQAPTQPPPEKPVESFRKAERDQKVEREQAPKGDDVRDQHTRPSLPAVPVPPPPAETKTVKKPQEKTVPKKTLPKKSKPVKKSPKGKIPAKKSEKTEKEQPQKSLPPLLTPQQLRPDMSTLNRIVYGTQGKRNRLKQRDNLPIGDEVWLNLQQNMLVSFFRRFHDQVELVWNYPAAAARNGIEGILELLITVDRDGELVDVDLLHSSGSDILDFEAIQAIYRAAPFGPLTKHYPHPQLKMHVYFRYTLGGRSIYGR